MSRRQYDAARAAAGHRDLPTAAQVLRRTRSGSWPQLLAVLTDERRDLDRTLGQRAGREHIGGFTAAHVALALRDVARSLGQRTLSAREYEDVRVRTVRHARRRRIAVRMPTVGQIEAAAGGWEQACRIAGLRPGTCHERPGGIAVVDALEIAVDALGVVPSRRQLERLARHNEVALARPTRPRAETIAEVARRRAQRGLSMPGPAVGARVEDFEVDVPALRGPRAHHSRWTREQCVAAVAAWLADLAPHERPTQRSYARWWAMHPGRPAASALGRHGGLRRLRQTAESSAGRS